MLIILSIFVFILAVAVLGLQRRMNAEKRDRESAKTWADCRKTDDAHWALMRERRERHAHEQAHTQAHADHQVTRQRVDALYEHFKLQPVLTTPEAPKMVCVTKT